MSDERIRIGRRRLLASIATVGGASAAAGAGTTAFFTDSEVSTGNTVRAGTLNLTLEGGEQAVTFLSESAIAPGDSGSGNLDIDNTGSVDGELNIGIGAIRSTDNKGGSPGQLEDYLEVSARLEGTSTGQTPIFSQRTVADLRTTTITKQVPIPAGESRQFVLEWILPQSTPNEARGDSVGLDFTFNLVQSGGA